MIKLSKDRLGRSFTLQLMNGALSFGIVWGHGQWAGVLYMAKRRIWIRPINYAAIKEAE